MLRNYFIVAIRSLARNKSYSIINITGLTLGITACLIIFLIIARETSYDDFHPGNDRIYRIAKVGKSSTGIEKRNVTPYPLAAAMRNDFPDLKEITEFHFQDQALVSFGDEKMNVSNIIFADSSFLDVFGFQALSGNPKKELAQPGKAFLSEAFAKKIGNKNLTHFKLNNLIEVEVAGIIKTPPSPSHIDFNIIVSYPSLTKEFTNFPLDAWTLTASGYSYVKLPSGVLPEDIEARFPGIINKYYSTDDARNERLVLRPLSGIHFDTEFDSNPGTTSTSKSTIYVLAFIGLFLLVIACVNFINLTTALSFRKSKEAGVRKTMGAQEKQLVFQYLSETVLITVFATALAIGLSEWLAPVVGSFLGTYLELNLLQNPQLIFFLICIVILTSVLSGLYPSLVLSRFSPVRALKNKVSDPRGASSILRKSLVVLQFFIAQVLIICTLVVAGQINFFRSTSMGFARESIIDIPVPNNSQLPMESLRNKLLSNSDIQAVSLSLGAPVSDNEINTDVWLTESGEREKHDVSLKAGDINYGNVFGLKLMEGRWFLESEEKQASTGTMKERIYPYILTESAVKALGFNDAKAAIGKNITSGMYNVSGPIVGVLKDFNTTSLKEKMKPTVVLPFPYFYYEAAVRISGHNVPETLKFIEKAWQEFYPENLFQYSFLDQYIGKMYAAEEKMFTLFEIFSGIAIFIGCLGLYGVASYMANQRTKEVAIRKTLGASVGQIVGLFSKEFVVLVIVAFLLAAPVSWYAMNQWLQTFAYQKGIGWSVFGAGILFTMTIAFLSVGYRSLRAAISNPVNALRSE